MITIISGTNRPDSSSLRLSNFYKELLTKQGEEAQVYSLRELPEDFANTNMYGNRTEDFQTVIDTFVSPINKFVFIFPEYNGSIPGVLKLFLDSMDPKLWHHKRAALVGLSAGRAGNLRGLDDMTNILHYLQVEVLSKKPKLSAFSSLVDNDRRLIDEASITLLKDQIIKFKNF